MYVYVCMCVCECLCECVLVYEHVSLCICLCVYFCVYFCVYNKYYYASVSESFVCKRTHDPFRGVAFLSSVILSFSHVLLYNLSPFAGARTLSLSLSILRV
jgi:hypothetical protein